MHTHTHAHTHTHTHMHAHTLTQPPPPILNQQDTNANASPTIPSAVVSRKFLEVCCLKPLVASIHCAHDSWPWLFEHLQKKQHITQVKKPHKKRKEISLQDTTHLKEKLIRYRYSKMKGNKLCGNSSTKTHADRKTMKKRGDKLTNTLTK